MKNLTRTIGLAGAATLFVASVMSSVAYNKPPESNDFRPLWEKPSEMPDTTIPSIYREDSPIRLKDPANITTETQYDHATGDYTTVKKVGDLEIERPQTLSDGDYNANQNRSEMREYWRKQMMDNYKRDERTQSGLSRYLNPRINVNLKGFDRIFGSNVIDIKPQGNVEVSLGVDISKIDTTIYDILIGHATASEAVVPTCVERLDIITSRIDLVGAEIEMLNMPNRERVMARLLQPLMKDYDYILIDCSPSLGLITVNALTAADSVIIPVQCEYFALEGISKLLNTIKIIKTKLNTKLEIEGFLLTMYDSRLRLANQIYDEVKRHFQELVFKTVIQRNVKLSESPSHGLPVILYDADSTGAKNHLALAKEIINKNS